MNYENTLPHFKPIYSDLLKNRHKLDKQHQQQSNLETNKKRAQEKHSIYVIDLVELNMRNTKKYGNVRDQKIREDTKEGKGNFSIATFSRKDLTEKNHNWIKSN